DQVEPLEAGAPGHGAPEVPLDGPAEQSWPNGPSPSLHARITARSTAVSAGPSAPGAHAHQVSTDRVVHDPTRADPAAPRPAALGPSVSWSPGDNGPQLTEASRPSRWSGGIALALLAVSAVCLVAAL